MSNSFKGIRGMACSSISIAFCSQFILKLLFFLSSLLKPNCSLTFSPNSLLLREQTSLICALGKTVLGYPTTEFLMAKSHQIGFMILRSLGGKYSKVTQESSVADHILEDKC